MSLNPDGTVARGTSNGNDRGSVESRRRRRAWLIETYAAARPLTVDRIIPGTRGGKYVRTNIRPCCGPCNSSTGSKLARRGKKR